MIKGKYRSTKSKILKLCVAFLFPFTLFGGLASLGGNVYAESADYAYSHQESVEVTNSSFTEGSSPYAQGNSLSGWSAIETSSNATGMLIDVGTGTNTEDSGANQVFSENQDTYMLQENPRTYSRDDSRILMINSKSTKNSSNVLASKGYRSSSITLEANSYYRFSVAVKTMNNGDDDSMASASIYLSGLGLEDEMGNEKLVGAENIVASNWTVYYIFVATGSESKTVTLDLYLGGKNISSTGVVFFDEVHVERYSENAFFDECYATGEYFGQDTLDDLSRRYCFVVDELSENQSLIDTTGYNFDFEEAIDIVNQPDTLGDDWSIVEKSKGHAIISDIRTKQPGDFFDQTGYYYTGNDFSYQNTQAMLLYTDADGGYVGVESADFDIKAHGIYKVSVNVKFAGTLSSGSFYIKVQENGSIYDIYSDILTDDEDETGTNRQYYALQEGQTSGYSSNNDNAFTNDYQTIEFYIKGHSLYDTSVNFQLWLGDSSTSANGCAVVDNIQVEYATNEEFAGGSNTLELLSFANTPSTFTNPYFNATEFDGATLEYPVVASGWTVEKENDRSNESGVIYLYNEEHYQSTYVGNYDWAGINPGNPTNSTDVTLPNNVYMMYNRYNSYQSITSSSFELSGNSYYKLSFNYYNQEGMGSVNPSSINVDVVDANGIVLFSRENISSIDSWSTMDIYFHTAETLTSTVTVCISLGEEDAKVGGYAYLDNFTLENLSSSESFNEEEFVESVFNNAVNKTDLSNYYFNLTENGEVTNQITSSPAYNLSVDTVYDPNVDSSESENCAVAGLISGKNNPYGENFIIDDSNYLVLQTLQASQATITSNYTLSLEADTYYKMTFDLATLFNAEAKDASTDEHDCQYGVTITIEGYDPITRVINESQLKSYSIYFHSTKESTPTISFSLVSDCHETLGVALITRFDVTSVEEAEYTNAGLSSQLGQTVFTTSETASADDDTSDDDTTTDDDTTAPDNGSNAWLLIPSLIFGAAIIIAIIGFILRHIKIKKIEKIRKETYDRKLSVNHDVILSEAQKRRDQEVADLIRARNMLESDKAKMEQDHKDFVKESRLNNQGKLTRELEKELKRYNNNMIRLDEKINIIKEKIDTVMSAEYLLTLERRIVAEEDEKYRAEKRSYKAQIKELKAKKDAEQKESTQDDNKEE